jgi:hypothetical protein
MTGQAKAESVYDSPEFWEKVTASMHTESPKVAAFDKSAPPLSQARRERLALLLNSNR